MAGKTKKYMVQFPIKGLNGERYKAGDTIELEPGSSLVEEWLDRGIVTDGKRGLEATSGLAAPMVGTYKAKHEPKRLTLDPAEDPITIVKE